MTMHHGRRFRIGVRWCRSPVQRTELEHGSLPDPAARLTGTRY